MTLTPTVLTDARIYYESVDVTGFGNKVDLSSSAVDLDRTTFASGGWVERTGGLFDSQAGIEGFWDAGDLTKPDDGFWAGLGASGTAVTVVPAAGTVGSLAYVAKMLQTDYKPGAKVGQLLAWTATAKGQAPIARGQILHPQGTARTSTGTGTGVQLGAVLAAQRIYANLHVMSISGTGTPTITVSLQSSVDNTFASPTTRITFLADAVLDGQALSALGAITDTWWRAAWTISGTTPSFLFAVSAGIAPK
jgi:hypothetical protein